MTSTLLYVKALCPLLLLEEVESIDFYLGLFPRYSYLLFHNI